MIEDKASERSGSMIVLLYILSQMLTLLTGKGRPMENSQKVHIISAFQCPVLPFVKNILEVSKY